MNIFRFIGPLFMESRKNSLNPFSLLLFAKVLLSMISAWLDIFTSYNIH